MATKQIGGTQLLNQMVGGQLANRQRLVLSGQMQQKLRLLHMPSHDLAKFLSDEVERNPFLAKEGAVSTYAEQGASTNFADLSAIEAGQLAPSPTLQAHVREQIFHIFSNLDERHIAYFLTEQLDEAGYFCGDLKQCVRQLGKSHRHVEQILSQLQTDCDPSGIFAHSLAHCLELQLKRQGLFDSIFAKLLQDLNLIARRDIATLAKICRVERYEIEQRLEHIISLDPKPGQDFYQDQSQVTLPVIIPDAFIDLEAQHKIHVTLNEAILPKLIMHHDYRQIVGETRAERQFIKNYRSRAKWLLEALDGRAKTLLKVITAIINIQKDFLYEGAEKLKPLGLVQIAEAANLHESTISRTIADKYVAVRKNGYHFKHYRLHDFFSHALPSNFGKQPHAARAVAARLAKIIDDEFSPLSDEAIAHLLKQEGISIARRTVAKYREQLHIAPSHQRKKSYNERT